MAICEHVNVNLSSLTVHCCRFRQFLKNEKTVNGLDFTIFSDFIVKNSVSLDNIFLVVLFFFCIQNIVTISMIVTIFC
jgi:hypothetical protein